MKFRAEFKNLAFCKGTLFFSFLATQSVTVHDSTVIIWGIPEIKCYRTHEWIIYNLPSPPQPRYLTLPSAKTVSLWGKFRTELENVHTHTQVVCLTFRGSSHTHTHISRFRGPVPSQKQLKWKIGSNSSLCKTFTSGGFWDARVWMLIRFAVLGRSERFSSYQQSIIIFSWCGVGCVGEGENLWWKSNLLGMVGR